MHVFSVLLDRGLSTEDKKYYAYQGEIYLLDGDSTLRDNYYHLRHITKDKFPESTSGRPSPAEVSPTEIHLDERLDVNFKMVKLLYDDCVF
jgi:hypothetical protein